VPYHRGVPAPRFSAVIAAYNAEGTITAAVDSALSQSARDLEVIVVDDGSTDGTAEVVRAIPDARVRLVSQVNQGQAAARNAGTAVATGTYVGFLDSDDLWLPDYLELAGRALERVSNPGFAYTDAFVFDSQTGRVRRQSAMHEQRPPVPPPHARDEFLLELLSRNFVYVSTVVPRSVLLDVGGYTESLRRSEDYSLALRILIRGYDPAWVPGNHALYRAHPGQMSRQKLSMIRSALTVFRQIEPESLPSDAHRAMLASRIRQHEQEMRVLEGEDRVRFALRAARSRVGWVRRRLGLAYTWYRQPPGEVAAAFPNLKSI
jgi:glycosyltransferase involved in cell wall biosynthesis